MALVRVEVNHEHVSGGGAQGALYLGDVRQLLPQLIDQYAGTVKTLYLDPPFLTGKRFDMRVHVGEKEWKSGSSSLTITAYQDLADRESYLAMMREVLTESRKLLRDDGMAFLHIDYRMHAHLRLMMDEIYGEDNLLNEIIWMYQSGGRSTRHFSRKHDIILFYRKTKDYDFDISQVGVPRTETRHNHMRRHVDADGRVYRSIRSGGRVYTYYDDEPVPPGDVWDDVSHLQQKDPQRTGYDTQKPLRLLERIVLCSAREGERVCDLFCGSGTTLAAASRLGRSFLGADKSRVVLNTARRRLLDAELDVYAAPGEGEGEVQAELHRGIAFYDVELKGYDPRFGERAFAGMDAVDNWSVGYLRNGCFEAESHGVRTRRKPVLPDRLQLPVYEGSVAIRIADVYGREFYYRFDDEE